MSVTDKHQKDKELLNKTDDIPSPFCLLLKHTEGLRVGPKSTMEIPLSFTPEDMKLYEATVTVRVRKEDGAIWHYNLADESG